MARCQAGGRRAVPQREARSHSAERGPAGAADPTAKRSPTNYLPPMPPRLLLAALVMATAAPAAAQVEIVEHGPFSAMLEAYRAENADDSRRLEGFRIQVIATTDRLRLEEAERKFRRAYPEYPVDWNHEPPYYKLRTGAFTERERATAFLYRIKRTFPSAYPAMVKDIRPSELLAYRP